MAHWPLEYDDAVGYGQLGLVEAAHGFDPTRGIKFATYANYRIRGAILDAMREADPLPRHARDFLNGHPPESRSHGLRRPKQTVGQPAWEFYSTLQLHSLDQVVNHRSYDGNRDASLVGDRIIDEGCLKPDEGDEYDWPALFAALDPRERAIVQLTVLDGRQGPAIARRLGISEARVGQLKRRAYKKLRRLVEQQRCA